jgi:hypothetical protein
MYLVQISRAAIRTALSIALPDLSRDDIELLDLGRDEIADRAPHGVGKRSKKPG